jgi:hypothetical protein
MCDFSEKLVLWLDGELPAGEAAGVKRHLRVCAECARRLRAYKRASGDFAAYCDAVTAAEVPDKLQLWSTVLSGAATIAAVALLLIFANARVLSLRHGVSLGTTRETSAPAPDLPARLVASAAPAIPLAAIHHLAVVHHRRASVVGTNSAQSPAQHPEQRAEQNQAMQNQPVAWLPAEPDIRVAIPAEAMFAPGAIPEGVSFIADVGFAADGSAQGIRFVQ